MSVPHVGFYLHACWQYRHPFSVRSWSDADYAGMFTVLKAFGYDQVMMWPVVEALPMPLSDADRQELRGFRSTITAARAAGLEAWLVQCGNLTSTPAIASKPWIQRNFYPFTKTVRLDDPAQTEPWLAHRAAIMGILNNADAYVTIDGDPGGYAGADPKDWVRVFAADQQVIAASGERPKQQRVIPWLWCGWGAAGVWTQPIRPFLDAELAALQGGLPGDWELLPGRSHRDGWANSRLPVQATVDAGLIGRSTIFCYEAIEFEPSVPQAKLQFDLIRANLAEERANLARARGVFGNAQQPIMVLPNMWFFAQAARDPAYATLTDEQILADLAKILGGDPAVLVPAWQCLALPLERLPAGLPDALRSAQLTSAVAQALPGGPDGYLRLLAAQVESQRRILVATAAKPVDDDDAAKRCSEAVTAAAAWWSEHQFSFDELTPNLIWLRIPQRQHDAIATWGRTLGESQLVAARTLAPGLLATAAGLPLAKATALIHEILPRKGEHD